MPEGAVFGPYDKPMKMESEKFAGFLRDVAVCVGEDDSMEGRIAYKWSEERGFLNVIAMVRTGNSQGQGGAWVLQDMDARVEADEQRKPALMDRLVAMVEMNNILSDALLRAGVPLLADEQRRVEALQSVLESDG